MLNGKKQQEKVWVTCKMPFNTPNLFLEVIGASGTKQSLEKKGCKCDGMENDLKRDRKQISRTISFNDFRLEMKFLRDEYEI